MAKQKSVLDEICDMLDTYKGRDKILRTLCYSSKLIGGLSNNEILAKRMGVFSSKMSGTRAVLRLLDDLPMLKYNLEYGFGGEEPDQLMASLGVTTNIIDQIYYPIEKMSFLAEHDLISNCDGNYWDTASSICWVLSIYLTLLKTMRYVTILQSQRTRGVVTKEGSEALEKLLRRQKFEILTCVRLSMDLVHAINTLPLGWLWGGKLKTWHIGLIATTSSFLGIYQMFAKRSL